MFRTNINFHALDHHDASSNRKENDRNIFEYLRDPLCVPDQSDVEGLRIWIEFRRRDIPGHKSSALVASKQK